MEFNHETIIMIAILIPYLILYARRSNSAQANKQEEAEESELFSTRSQIIKKRIS